MAVADLTGKIRLLSIDSEIEFLTQIDLVLK